VRKISIFIAEKGNSKQLNVRSAKISSALQRSSLARRQILNCSRRIQITPKAQTSAKRVRRAKRHKVCNVDYFCNAQSKSTML